ncbi:hypothetical protein BBP40_006902 [Aspergillus hancockii]|nr:hypothetical protein BBP40_006902 [Aspergillus hancockii]
MPSLITPERLVVKEAKTEQNRPQTGTEKLLFNGLIAMDITPVTGGRESLHTGNIKADITPDKCDLQWFVNQKLYECANALNEYLEERLPVYKHLREVREQGWLNPRGDEFYKRQRQQADDVNEDTSRMFYNMMKRIGGEIDKVTGVFHIKKSRSGQPKILDMCMAPGGFLETALNFNPGSSALGFSLPVSDGGHGIHLPKNTSVAVKFLDITMLAEDMGVTQIPVEHTDAKSFLPRQFETGQSFDLVLCDGQVLRTHDRARYREHRESRRLTVSQLALGLEHLSPGGSMVVLLHKAEAWDTVQLLYTFHKFSSVQLLKPMRYHAKRSSFYMIATEIQTHHPEAILALREWKRGWKVATFGSDEEYLRALCDWETDVEVVLREFGTELVRLGKPVWDIQAQALAQAPFVKAHGNR